MYKSLMTYSTDESALGGVALKLMLGFVLPMKDIFVQPQLLEAFVSGSLFGLPILLFKS